MHSPLTKECLDRWLSSATEFQEYFIRFSINNAKAVGYYIEFNQVAFRDAHAEWVGRCKFWHEHYMLPTTTQLSHIKILALLICSFSQAEWIRSVSEFDPAADGIEFDGTDDELDTVRLDLNAGREAFFALHFATAIINWFEKGRIDQLGEFHFRMTKDLKHDLLAYLVQKKAEEMGVFLILKALYARNPKPKCPI